MTWSRPTFDISVDFLLRVQILEPFQDLPQNCGNLCFVKGTWFQLGERVSERIRDFGLNSTDCKQFADHIILIMTNRWNWSFAVFWNGLTKSRADPPPKYSIIIHNFVPWKTDQQFHRIVSEAAGVISEWCHIKIVRSGGEIVLRFNPILSWKIVSRCIKVNNWKFKHCSVLHQHSLTQHSPHLNKQHFVVQQKTKHTSVHFVWSPSMNSHNKKKGGFWWIRKIKDMANQNKF